VESSINTVQGLDPSNVTFLAGMIAFNLVLIILTIVSYMIHRWMKKNKFKSDFFRPLVGNIMFSIMSYIAVIVYTYFLYIRIN